MQNKKIFIYRYRCIKTILEYQIYKYIKNTKKNLKIYLKLYNYKIIWGAMARLCHYYNPSLATILLKNI